MKKIEIVVKGTLGRSIIVDLIAKTLAEHGFTDVINEDITERNYPIPDLDSELLCSIMKDHTVTISSVQLPREFIDERISK